MKISEKDNERFFNFVKKITKTLEKVTKTLGKCMDFFSRRMFSESSGKNSRGSLKRKSLNCLH